MRARTAGGVAEATRELDEQWPRRGSVEPADVQAAIDKLNAAVPELNQSAGSASAADLAGAAQRLWDLVARRGAPPSAASQGASYGREPGAEGAPSPEPPVTVAPEPRDRLCVFGVVLRIGPVKGVLAVPKRVAEGPLSVATVRALR